MSSFKNSNLAQAWLVLLLATVFGVALAGIQVQLSPVIEANKTRETMEKIPDLVLGASSGETGENKDSENLVIQPRMVEVEKHGVSKLYPVYDVRLKDGSLVGHVAKAKGQGYADKIEVLVGLDPGGQSITGLFILDQKETPGLGNRILEKAWRDQFIDKSTHHALVVVKTGKKHDNEIDAISGATISSRAVTDILNSAIADIKPGLIPKQTIGNDPKENLNNEETE